MNKVKETSKILKGAWDELKRPDDFWLDWYGAATNQISHIFIGLVSSGVIASSYSLFFGEMPFRINVLCAVFTIFVIFVQIINQGWNGKDTFWDTYFVTLGLSAGLYSFLEIKVPDYDTVLVFFPERLLLFFLVGFVSLLIHLWPRMRRQYGSRSDDR